MKILITGADGFIGSHLSEMLIKKNFDVRLLIQYNSNGNLGNLENSKYISNKNIVFGDIRDQEFCNNLTKEVNIIFNLAALIAIPYSYQAISSYIDTNVIGTMNLCNSALKNNIDYFYQISTSEVYGSAQYVPIDELHPLKPQSPYSASKIASDNIALSYFYSFNLPVSVIRPFNNYGPRQSLRAVIPTIITQIALGSKKIKLGKTDTSRDFNFVEDTANFFIEIIGNEKLIGQTINFGTGNEVKVFDIAKKIMQIMNCNIDIELDENRLRPENSEVSRLCCDNSLMKSLVDFQHQYNIDSGLKKTVEWFQDNKEVFTNKFDIYNK